VSEKTDGYAYGIIIVEMLTNMSCLEARNLVDEHERETLLQELQELAAKGGWPKQVAQILSSVATMCTRGTKTRTTPAQVLAQTESAYAASQATTSAEVDEV
jgi:hypothetical protein